MNCESPIYIFGIQLLISIIAAPMNESLFSLEINIHG